jgi:2-keto-4-pentenoate hydratase/2-oxohepta-3-ene-1,7-dioic acid hydratase in catechol pathway
MTIPVLRTVDAWWVALPDGTARRIDTTATSTRDLLNDRQALLVARDRPIGDDEDRSALIDLQPISPVTTPCRVVAQMTNYVSHVRDSGMDPDTVPLTFFRKTSASICGPNDEIIRPAHVRFLDYEVEIGLVIGCPIRVGDTVDAVGAARHVAALVVTNDVSARDVQLPKTQFFESKSYPTFTPVGPVLLVLEPGDFDRFGDLRLQLSVNGELRQDSTVADMIYHPLQALRALARFQPLDTGDLVLTGTPGGTALKAPPRVVEVIGSMLPAATKWKAFFKRQAGNRKYLQEGDVVEATIATPDGALELGRQTNTVRAHQ